MKHITYIFLGIVLIGFSSCFKKDNWAAPDARISGTITDSYTGKPLLSSQGDWRIRIWERSWTESVPINQELAVKQDGTYNNSKLFAGTYDMLPYGGPFWPVDTVKNVIFSNRGTNQDFTVTPYLQVIDFDAAVVGTNLIMKCRLKAPKRLGLPNLVEVRPFLSLTNFVGESNNIDIPEYTNKRIDINAPWSDKWGDDEISGVYQFDPIPVKAGYTYNVRIGANVNDANRKYNYSEIKQIIVK